MAATDEWKPGKISLETVKLLERLAADKGAVNRQWYILTGDHKPVKATREEFVHWDDFYGKRVVCRSMISLGNIQCLVSTIFMGIDMARDGWKEPVLYETRSLWINTVVESEFVQYMDRGYAKQIHEQMIDEVMKRIRGESQKVSTRLLKLAELANGFMANHREDVPDVRK